MPFHHIDFIIIELLSDERIMKPPAGNPIVHLPHVLAGVVVDIIIGR
jgi:hypothetical protein